MKSKIIKSNSVSEFNTPERCFIKELYNNSDNTQLSIAQARVEPGITTAWHLLKAISERYLIISGQGRVEIAGLESTNVLAGDVVVIPPDTAQRITNTGLNDLLFYAICTPRFVPECYLSLE